MKLGILSTTEVDLLISKFGNRCSNSWKIVLTTEAIKALFVDSMSTSTVSKNIVTFPR